MRRVLPVIALLLALWPASAHACGTRAPAGVPEIPTLERAAGLPADILAERWASLELIIEARAGSARRHGATRSSDRILSGRDGADLIARLRTQQTGAPRHPAIDLRTGYLAARASAVPPPFV